MLFSRESAREVCAARAMVPVADRSAKAKVSLSVFTSDNPRRLSGLSPLEPESLVVRLSPSLVNAISADLTRLISPARLVSTLGLRKESTSAPVCGLLLRQDHLRNRAD